MKKKSKKSDQQQERGQSKIRAFFQAKMDDYHSHLDRVIALPETLAVKWESLLADVVGYRLLLMELYDHPRKIDKTLWEDVEACRTKKDRLLRSTFRFWMRIPWLLRRRIRQFESMVGEIDELIAFVDKAKKGARFYSKMQKGKSVKKESIVPGGESINDVRESLHALIRVLHYLFLREKMGQPVTAGSSVLQLDDALFYWENELRIIAAYMRDGGISKDRLIQNINDLRNQLQETPSQAQLVLDFEMRVLSLLKLTKAYQLAGKDNVPSDILVELLRSFDEDIPFAWARGQWETMERSLLKAKELIISVEAFLRFGRFMDAASLADETDESGIRDWARKRWNGPAGKRPFQAEPLDDEAVDTLLEEMLARHLGEDDDSVGEMGRTGG
jgi:hypothetical protein